MTDYVGTQSCGDGASETVPSDDIPESLGESLSTTTGTSDPEMLIGAEDDSLIPTTVDIQRVFQEGRETWTQFVNLAKSLPPNSVPAGLADPSVMLKDIPALPKKLPKRGILTGQPVWYISNPEHQDARQDGEWNSEHVRGQQKDFILSAPGPIECTMSSRPDFVYFGHASQSRDRPPAPPEGVSLLTLCWSYIISARFAELKGMNLVYTSNFIRPRISRRPLAKRDNIALRFESPVSHQFIRWLCAILAPKPGWCGEKGDTLPWAAFCSGDSRTRLSEDPTTGQFIISLDQPISFGSNVPPPTSDQATDFLIELCTRDGLGPAKSSDGKAEVLSPPTAAFFAALAIPFYQHVKLRPQFPIPALKRRKIDPAQLEPLRQYVTDLRYYMTLSLHPRTLGSVIWSIFWQPEIECNLVSPWLSAIFSVIRPIIRSCNLALLAKTFAFRRPRVALWWLGIFLLGNPTPLNWIATYLETLEERFGFGSMAPPDVSAAAWVGSPQSFLDDDMLREYTNRTDLVPRADILRIRHDLRLRDSASLPLSWRPFGSFSKSSVELELWPLLECGIPRRYLHWEWWVKADQGLVRDTQLGFQKDTGRFTKDVPDRLEMVRASDHGVVDDIKLIPSKNSTLRMMSYCLMDASGDRGADISAVVGSNSHRWLKGWRGLE
ncbi:hypothetical protein TOPH_03868 [Tolypocladium ophioglossoides CBS 100239]|uniref:Uncharacterized protein n=1 Tax=Tolypocladium ophioglossoides (strain CBS 100239) TaxID=1163406 RepID=A0A0L0NCU0_TOLOC|nr:hypothetical protein TOPH_03868 [Tolypocladium ophioglossoides CBS 100239]